jgi:hypothetical protein
MLNIPNDQKGKKQFQRMQKSEQFGRLMVKFNIKEYNNRNFIKIS